MPERRNLGGMQIGASGPSGTSVLRRIERDLAHELNHLLHLLYDLGLAYRTAIRRMNTLHLREEMIRIDASHAPIRAQLRTLICDMGAPPALKSDLHGLIERVRVVVGDLKGDSGILHAMAENEEDMSSALRVAKHHPGMPPKALAIIEGALEHEASHRDFYNRALGRFLG